MAEARREQREYDAETVRDYFSAPGRHITEWDGGWTDAVAAALLISLTDAILADKEPTDGLS